MDKNENLNIYKNFLDDLKILKKNNEIRKMNEYMHKHHGYWNDTRKNNKGYMNMITLSCLTLLFEIIFLFISWYIYK